MSLNNSPFSCLESQSTTELPVSGEAILELYSCVFLLIVLSC
ncbi:unnamed protein product [Schistosoma curassoni]|uniref:Uncharacterized protein n=1 Tax=Schistosoma curassoni TaxID=6186 RepID=A0A183KTU0_9TREM|nr:unnamed protein product [Schistosoma curassoni]